MKITSSMIDSELRTFGRVFKIVIPSFSEAKLRLFHRLRRNPKVKAATFQYREQWLPRADGSRLRLCIFAPLTPAENVPGVLWLHGGGYAIGSPEEAAIMAQRFIAVTPCVIVSPDYRLSPDAPYPAALEDSYASLLWLKDHARELGIRDNQLMVGGDSAGGGLAAALTHYARDKGEVKIAFQMPLYPMLDDRQTCESAIDNDAPVWNSKSNDNAWKLYLGESCGSTDVSCYAAAARAADFSRLPPAATFVGDIEPFRDETIAYVENLKKAGVPVHFEIYPGAYHAFQQMCPQAAVSQKAIAFLIDAFKYATEHYFTEQ